MDTLRIILIIAGLVLIAGIYFRETRLQSGRREESQGVDDPLEMDGFSVADQLYPELGDGTGFSARSDDPSIEEMWETGGTGEAEDVVMVLSLMASEAVFKGPEIMAAAKNSGLHLGQMDIFHYFPDTGGVNDLPWFGMANALEPGTFDLERISELETPGLIFFLQLPAPVDGVMAFHRMLETAQTFNRELGGQLCDERRQPLGMARLTELRERAHGFKAMAVRVGQDGEQG
ncbi:cell division protein ZipA C-terminal FtsZ-binding domain-containing protein [Thiohalomonas denitrificans]|uniref:cell division protein ZipA C-terminal FtsZ-binding domain-containing protein n=1 Tax=Thiohalomonas denitrificans TaxID=415747 RepID=UPI0026E9D160|nr:cell division protein ZipA C-terminal FtsZ-binding domain-containing protein [Thiohalomonas denitrificans]